MIPKQIFQNAVDLINKSTNILITTHTRADGDAAGCCASINEALTSLGKKTQILLLSTLPQWYGFLFDSKIPVLGQDVSPEQLAKGEFGRFDLIIILDTNSYSQLPKIDSWLKLKSAPILIIDHHATSDCLGFVELDDSHAAAACSVVYQLFKFANWPITPKIAEAIFTGIATDSGWFHFNNTNEGVLRDCAQLIKDGAIPSKIYHYIFYSFTPERYRLMTVMQNTLQLHFDNRYASQHLMFSDFKTTGAKFEDTENLINECQRIASVEVAALFVELKDGRIRCSLRSSGSVDVCKIAQQFSGGGHKSAAGAYMPAPMDNAKKLIYDAVNSQLKQGLGPIQPN
jgi:bifunctional oligoribonuclease and PAP phosphatase NrnA